MLGNKGKTGFNGAQLPVCCCRRQRCCSAAAPALASTGGASACCCTSCWSGSRPSSRRATTGACDHCADSPQHPADASMLTNQSKTPQQLCHSSPGGLLPAECRTAVRPAARVISSWMAVLSLVPCCNRADVLQVYLPCRHGGEVHAAGHHVPECRGPHHAAAAGGASVLGFTCLTSCCWCKSFAAWRVGCMSKCPCNGPTDISLDRAVPHFSNEVWQTTRPGWIVHRT